MMRVKVRTLKWIMKKNNWRSKEYTQLDLDEIDQVTMEALTAFPKIGNRQIPSITQFTFYCQFIYRLKTISWIFYKQRSHSSTITSAGIIF